jgi:DNA-binding SARP family transcriptional activator
VVAGLAFDEEHVRVEILRLAAGPQPRVARQAPPDHEQPPLRIWLLGSCHLSFEGRCLEGGNGDRAAAVLRYLAAQPDTGVHKEQLTEQFWPDTNERSARRCLHQVIYNIRRRLQDIGADHELRFVNDRYILGSPARWRDVDELERAVTAARQACDGDEVGRVVAACQRADQLYAGDFLADHPFDEWANGPRRHYRVLFREATGMLLDRWTEDGRNGRVVELATRLLGFDPSDEAAARHLMEAQARLGQSQLAAEAYVDLGEALADLGLTPADATRAVAHRIMPSRHQGGPSMSGC